MTASWINKKKAELTSIKQLEKALMNRPDMRAALNRYIASLNLQGQINAGKITEKQALELFARAIQQFSYTISKEINARFTPQLIDQNNLSNPLNMEQAINNPNSFVNIQINDTAASIILAINEEAVENEKTQNQQKIINEDSQEEAEKEIQTQYTPEPPAPTPKPTSHEKEELLATAVLGVSLKKEVIEHAFGKYIDKDLKNIFHKLEKPSETNSPFKILTPKLEPPTPHEKK